MTVTNNRDKLLELDDREADALRTFSPFSDATAKRLVARGMLTGGHGCYFRTPLAEAALKARALAKEQEPS